MSNSHATCAKTAQFSLFGGWLSPKIIVMKLTYLRSARSFYLLSFAFAIGIAGFSSLTTSPEHFEALAFFVRLLGSAIALYACSKLTIDAKLLLSRLQLERIRPYDVALCGLLLLNFVLAGILLGSLFVASPLAHAN